MRKRSKKKTKEINEKQIETKSTAADLLSLSGIRKKHVSPLNAPVWRLALIISAGCVAAWLIGILFSFHHPIAIWTIGFMATASWIIAIRMLMLDARLKKFWIVWLAGGFLFILFLGGRSNIWIASVSFTFIFLLFRRYKPYRHLTSRRRAGLFLLGLFIFSLLTLGWIPSKMEDLTSPQPKDFPQSEDFSLKEAKPDSFATFGRSLASYALWSLRLFWFFSLLHIFLGIRLHFMKLRPKLAVSAFLIAVVPLFLIIVMGLVSTYGILGVDRAARARTILEEWANLAVLDKDFIHSISDRSFSFETRRGKIQTRGDIPSWLSGFLLSLNKEDSPYQNVTESAAYISVNSELWLARLSHPGEPNARVEGCLVDNTMMNRLAQILHCDVKLSPSETVLADSNSVSIKPEKSDSQSSTEIYGKFLPEDKSKKEPEPSTPSFWKRSLYFGMTHLDVVSHDSGKFEDQKILLMTEVSISSITSELFSGENPLSLVTVLALSVLAFLLLIMETFALFFGVRITTGITSAVKTLHRGTRRIAKGDLDTQIVIPSEDELGDLAASFNEMTVAVKKGREEAMARERLERELETAREIQEKLLPHEMPRVRGFEIAGTSVPSHQVGGDYFDFLETETGQLGIAIADVSGKGIPAALLMANLQASLHAQIIKPGKVAETASRMNNLLVRSTDSHMFATFFYGILDRNKSTFTSTNAGHNPPILVRADRKIKRLEKGGLVLGFLPEQQYAQETVTLKEGDVLVLYTDGITEAVGPSSEKISENLFGEKRLIKVILANVAKTAREIQSAILKAISSHTANAPQYDDITLVVIKRTEQP